MIPGFVLEAFPNTEPSVKLVLRKIYISNLPRLTCSALLTLNVLLPYIRCFLPDAEKVSCVQVCDLMLKIRLRHLQWKLSLVLIWCRIRSIKVVNQFAWFEDTDFSIDSHIAVWSSSFFRFSKCLDWYFGSKIDFRIQRTITNQSTTKVSKTPSL